MAGQGYYATASTVKPYLEQHKTNPEGLEANDWEYWYLGKGRDVGSYEQRAGAIGFWQEFAQETAYYISRWNDVLSA
jgi:hypothetical protein